jgi:hypothetical protein
VLTATFAMSMSGQAVSSHLAEASSMISSSSHRSGLSCTRRRTACLLSAYHAQMGIGVPDEVMVALSERRISLLLDHQAGQLVQPGQAATAIMMSTVVPVSGELKLASAAVRNDTRELDSRGSPRARPQCGNGPCTTCWYM